MAIANLKKVDTKLKKMYENQITATPDPNFVDRSDLLFAQMNFIAVANKQALKLV